MGGERGIGFAYYYVPQGACIVQRRMEVLGLPMDKNAASIDAGGVDEVVGL